MDHEPDWTWWDEARAIARRHARGASDMDLSKVTSRLRVTVPRAIVDGCPGVVYSARFSSEPDR